ncbi:MULTISPECIES: ABC transporter ATP-binding protein [Streptomyces]|uniref:ABC transporter ATP-binding protein n=1 Tax=Streptomyces scabiei TaxID=1930 RepID=UPI0004E65E08|nr:MULTISPECIES: ATP-binding cassette domain-containing protein [Streptomyces]KFG03178.1 ABC transporter [Streptomyces scabiei]MBP5875818.1 ATP-binding cassette domain-containing protein [Streptomyces sp. LBUM 1477]MBP5899563.1 ATP-binding cassette domain-containing protein [Streptomyces sp. LBUM 1488]MDW8473044.1 ATP-binding cassette domain-containing protein [Streptomyces scabiei]MDX2570917.1 ATP-binding cassette domain-containing protein [Streptomyces scabiei]
MTLELVDCTYGYSRRKAPILRDFAYRLPDGLTILLGPNGAGKSTLLKLAASVHRPASGAVTLDGVPSHAKSYRRDVAWMPQDITPMPSLTAREYVAYIGWLKGMTRGDAWDRARHALTRVELAEQSDIRTSQLSGGQLRRVGVAGALVHDARVLLLDEPTAGMDPRQRRVFRDVLRSLADDVRVLMSTHDVADLAEEADHVTVLYGGEVLQTGPTDSFLAHTPPDTAPGRAAEGAYTALLMQHGAE